MAQDGPKMAQDGPNLFGYVLCVRDTIIIRLHPSLATNVLEFLGHLRDCACCFHLCGCVLCVRDTNAYISQHRMSSVFTDYHLSTYLSDLLTLRQASKQTTTDLLNIGGCSHLCVLATSFLELVGHICDCACCCHLCVCSCQQLISRTFGSHSRLCVLLPSLCVFLPTTCFSNF